MRPRGTVGFSLSLPFNHWLVRAEDPPTPVPPPPPIDPFPPGGMRHLTTIMEFAGDPRLAGSLGNESLLIY